MEEMLLVSLIGLLFAVIAGLYHTGNSRKVKKAEKQLARKCSIRNNTLYVTEQNKLFSNLLIIKAHTVSQYNREALKVHVGSATVGGITTGGVYTTGGGITRTDYHDGRVELVYRHVKKPRENEIHLTTFIEESKVETIVLSDELAKKARRSEIKDHVDGNMIRIVHASVRSSNAVAAENMRLGKTLRAVNQLSLERSAEYPSRAKCEAIIAWLCDE